MSAASPCFSRGRSSASPRTAKPSPRIVPSRTARPCVSVGSLNGAFGRDASQRCSPSMRSTGESSCSRVMTGSLPVIVSQGREISARFAVRKGSPWSPATVKPGRSSRGSGRSAYSGVPLKPKRSCSDVPARSSTVAASRLGSSWRLIHHASAKPSTASTASTTSQRRARRDRAIRRPVAPAATRPRRPRDRTRAGLRAFRPAR